MALIKCPECGREGVSDSALMCPGCGYSFANISTKKKGRGETSIAAQRTKAPLKFVWIISGILLLRFIILIPVSSSESSKLKGLYLPSLDSYYLLSDASATGIGDESLIEKMKDSEGVLSYSAPYGRLVVYLISFIVTGLLMIEVFNKKKYEKKSFKVAVLIDFIAIIIDVLGTVMILSALDAGSVIRNSKLPDGMKNGFNDGATYTVLIVMVIVMAGVFLAVCSYINKKMRHAVYTPDTTTM